jgi:hypothetical protein
MVVAMARSRRYHGRRDHDLAKCSRIVDKLATTMTFYCIYSAPLSAISTK